ncbi:MAG: hypothetical protein V1790_19515 [Planctomycetota bacterium]
MRFSTEQLAAADGAGRVALDWESLGRLVRVGTLDAVAMHFADLALDQPSEGERSRGLTLDSSRQGEQPAARGGMT